MINLLPLEEKKKLFLIKNERLAIVWCIIILVTLVCLALILCSIKFYILAETDNQKNILTQIEKKNNNPEFINLSNLIKNYNITLAQLNSFYKKEIYFNQALGIIIGIPNPKGLYLSNFSLSRNNDGTIQVSISGSSDTRNNLLLFKDSIEKNKKIINPYFSPESWISPKNANFSITFGINQNEQ